MLGQKTKVCIIIFVIFLVFCLSVIVTTILTTLLLKKNENMNKPNGTQFYSSISNISNFTSTKFNHDKLQEKSKKNLLKDTFRMLLIQALIQK